MLPALVFLSLFVAAPATQADVQVQYQQSTGRVPLVGDGDADRLILEPYVGEGRRGLRARQIGSGDPTIQATNINGCDTNPFVNDVVCSPLFGIVVLDTRGGRDTIRLHEREPHVLAFVEVDPASDDFIAPLCVATGGFAPGVKAVEGSLGPDGDVLSILPYCPLGQRPERNVNSVEYVLNVRGDDGQDVITGGRLSDTISGGDLGDQLDGAGADDTVRGDAGDDTLNGGPGGDNLQGGQGVDVLLGGPGVDTLDGGAQNDTFDGGPDADTFLGGTGDTATYATRAEGVVVDLRTAGGDGAGGGSEGDSVRTQNVIGGGGGDTLRGDDSPFGNSLDGGPGVDNLFGGAGPDTLTGGPGRDVFNGDAGQDFLKARDTVADTFDCGRDFDVVEIDLLDPNVPNGRGAVNCERLIVSPLDDGPPAELSAQVVRVEDGSASFDLSCPTEARVNCGGSLTLSEPGGEQLGRAQYLAELGATATVEVRVRGELGQGTRVLVSTVEQGVSQRGPRGVRALLPVEMAGGTSVLGPLTAAGGAVVLAGLLVLLLSVRRRRTPSDPAQA